MGTTSSVMSADKGSCECSSIDPDLNDPKGVMFDSACKGKRDQLLLVLQQGMDPNERESQSSG